MTTRTNLEMQRLLVDDSGRTVRIELSRALTPYEQTVLRLSLGRTIGALAPLDPADAVKYRPRGKRHG